MNTKTKKTASVIGAIIAIGFAASGCGSVLSTAKLQAATIEGMQQGWNDYPESTQQELCAMSQDPAGRDTMRDSFIDTAGDATVLLPLTGMTPNEFADASMTVIDENCAR